MSCFFSMRLNMQRTLERPVLSLQAAMRSLAAMLMRCVGFWVFTRAIACWRRQTIFASPVLSAQGFMLLADIELTLEDETDEAEEATDEADDVLLWAKAGTEAIVIDRLMRTETDFFIRKKGKERGEYT